MHGRHDISHVPGGLSNPDTLNSREQRCALRYRPVLSVVVVHTQTHTPDTRVNLYVVSAETWEKHKSIIQDLYIKQDLTLE